MSAAELELGRRLAAEMLGGGIDATPREPQFGAGAQERLLETPAPKPRRRR